MTQHDSWWTILVALDLGTASLTSSWVLARDTIDAKGQLYRRCKGNGKLLYNWFGSAANNTLGNPCLPTTLVYHRETKKLLYYGFEAQKYLTGRYPQTSPETVYVIKHPKLLLIDTEHQDISIAASARYRKSRETLKQVLDKDPSDVFEDLMTCVLNHVIAHVNRYSIPSIENFHIELIPCLPPGLVNTFHAFHAELRVLDRDGEPVNYANFINRWNPSIHNQIAIIAAKAMNTAITSNRLRDIKFGIQDVYLVSETICGCKAWLRSVVSEAALTCNVDDQIGRNVDGIRVGELFLVCDIGAGTGCLTLLRLVSKDPLQVEQLEASRSLDICGESVEANFETWLVDHLTEADYPGVLPSLISRICQQFSEDKKDCGNLDITATSEPWSVVVPGLRANKHKRFRKDCLQVSREQIESFFAPVIDRLEVCLGESLAKFPHIKSIVFLGQFGGSSEFLINRIRASAISSRVNVYHSDNGKLNVVQGALSNRANLDEVFISENRTAANYGFLVAVPVDNPPPGLKNLAAKALKLHDELAARNPKTNYQIITDEPDGRIMKVVEYRILKGSVVKNGIAGSPADKLFHTFPTTQEDIGFVDIVVVSTEDLPPQPPGKTCYTLWTDAHEENNLVVNGVRVNIEKIPFAWDLCMAKKLDNEGRSLGSYQKEDLDDYFFPAKKRKGKRRDKLGKLLTFEPIFHISEMQLKIFIKPIFKKPKGPQTMQLAEQLASLDDMYTRSAVPVVISVIGRESVSTGLQEDVEITVRSRYQAAQLTMNYESDDEIIQEVDSDSELELLPLPFEKTPERQHTLDVSRAQSEKQRSPLSGDGPQWTSINRDASLTVGSYSQNIYRERPNTLDRELTQAHSQTKTDGRLRDGCYSCKLRKRKCDGNTTSDNEIIECNECVRLGIRCVTSKPDSFNASTQIQLLRQEFSDAIQLGKKRARDDGGFSPTGNHPRSRAGGFTAPRGGKGRSTIREAELSQ